MEANIDMVFIIENIFIFVCMYKGSRLRIYNVTFVRNAYIPYEQSFLHGTGLAQFFHRDEWFQINVEIFEGNSCSGFG